MSDNYLRPLRLLSAALALGLFAGCATMPSPQTTGAAEPKTQAEIAKSCSASAAGEGPWEEGDVIIAYSDGPLTYSDMKTIYRASVPDPTRSFDDYKPDVRKKFMNEVSLDMLLAKEAQLRGIDKTPQYNINFKLWARSVLPKLWVEEEIGKKVSMPDSEILLWAPPALPDVRVRVIVKKDSDSAQKVYQDIKSGIDIVSICKTESEGLSQAKECLSDYINTYNYGTFTPPVVQKFLDSAEGELLEPYYGDIGYLVVQVVDKRTPEELTKIWLEKSRADYITQRQREVYEKKLAEIKDQLKANINQKVMDQLSSDLMSVTAEPLVEIDGVKFTVAEVLDQAIYGTHAEMSYSSTVNKFIDEIAVVTYCLKSGYANENKRFQELLAVNRNLLLSKTLKQQVGDEAASAEVTDDQLAEFLKANQKDYMAPEERRFQLMILEGQESVDAVYKRLGAGEDFGVIASQVSLHSESAPKGGDIGFFPKSAMPQPIGDPAFELEEGKYNEKPIAVDIAGKPSFVITKITAVRNAAPLGLESVKKPMVEGRYRTFQRSKSLSLLLKTATQNFGYVNCMNIAK